MRDVTWIRFGRRRSFFIVAVTFALILSSHIGKAFSMPSEGAVNQWPTFPRRNVAALARDGYLKVSPNNFKRSISTLAKNGQLPTFRAPYDETDKHQQDEGTNEKRAPAYIEGIHPFYLLKRNVQALARDGYRGGRGQRSDKRNLASIVRAGGIHKRDELGGDEYFYPFYQNPVPPLSEIDGPFDLNELYDFQQSVNPDMFPPLSQVYKRYPNAYVSGTTRADPSETIEDYLNRLLSYRTQEMEPNYRNKRYILTLPDEMDENDVDDSDNNADKRSVGSIPLTRISELGNISLIPKLSQQSIQTTPTYRRRQYLLTRTQPAESSTDR